MYPYPKIKAVRPLRDKRLLVAFDNDVQRIYDCTPLLVERSFLPLNSDTLFRAVKVDPGGYGISWNDDVDLSEAELWLNGVPAAMEEQPALDETPVRIYQQPA